MVWSELRRQQYGGMHHQEANLYQWLSMSLIFWQYFVHFLFGKILMDREARVDKSTLLKSGTSDKEPVINSARETGRLEEQTLCSIPFTWYYSKWVTEDRKDKNTWLCFCEYSTLPLFNRNGGGCSKGNQAALTIWPCVHHSTCPSQAYWSLSLSEQYFHLLPRHKWSHLVPPKNQLQ